MGDDGVLCTQFLNMYDLVVSRHCITMPQQWNLNLVANILTYKIRKFMYHKNLCSIILLWLAISSQVITIPLFQVRKTDLIFLPLLVLVSTTFFALFSTSVTLTTVCNNTCYYNYTYTHLPILTGSLLSVKFILLFINAWSNC